MVDSIIVDLDNTLSFKTNTYENAEPNLLLIKKLIHYRKKKFKIIIFTSRNMRSFNKDIKKIKEISLPKIKRWLEKYQVPYDEIIVGKPWCGENGFYIDDRALRPDEFVSLDDATIRSTLKFDNN
jgi:capsule biosynthesis phosphatase